ncbi:MAG: class I SAM-dependent methyltransferase [Coriobacteriia bacterium]|nr:class I SAM-dependent methyltransferase [Coriobacteriia bacterium]
MDIERWFEAKVRFAGEVLLGYVNRKTWERLSFKRLTERPLEYAFAMSALAEVCPQRVLDVGSGRSPWPALLATCGFGVTAIDAPQEYWKGQRLRNPHFHVLEADITSPDTSRAFDFITCISVMEHIPDHDAAFAGVVSLLTDGGHAVLSFPYHETEYIPNVYDLPDAGYGKDYDFVCQAFSRTELDRWLESNPVTLIRQDYFQVFTGQYWTVGERLTPFRRVGRDEPHQLTAILIRRDPASGSAPSGL